MSLPPRPTEWGRQGSNLRAEDYEQVHYMCSRVRVSATVAIKADVRTHPARAADATPQPGAKPVPTFELRIASPIDGTNYRHQLKPG